MVFKLSWCCHRFYKFGYRITSFPGGNTKRPEKSCLSSTLWSHRQVEFSTSSIRPSLMTLDDATSVLKRCPGGSVDLDTDPAQGTAVITLNNPEKRNAISGTMMLNLLDIVCGLEKWTDGRFVILRGSNGYFCSGADFKMVLHTLTSDLNTLAIPTVMQEVTSRILALPMISLAIVEGGALGGGAELTTCCDFRMALRGTRIAFLHTKLGALPGFGGGTRLIDIVGRNMALDLLASSRSVDMDEAEKIGFVNFVVDDTCSESAMLQAKDWLVNNFPHSTLTTRAAKQLIHQNSCQRTKDKLLVEKEMFAKLWGNPVHRKALGLPEK